MKDISIMEEDWDLLVSFFPENWKQMAQDSKAMKGLRQDKSEENFLRTLLIHLACGYSLRETVVRAREAKLADLSDVALLKRLRKSKDWLYSLCLGLFAERGFAAKDDQEIDFRLIDATNIKEPGKTGSLWRVHYSLRWPALLCDFFKLTATEGAGAGESLKHFELKPGEYVLADRGYSSAGSIHHAAACGAFLTVRLNPKGLRIQDDSGKPVDLQERLKRITRVNQVDWWPVQIPGAGNQAPVFGRLCVVRKSQSAIEMAKSKLRQKAIRKRSVLQPETLIYAEYVMVFTTFPEERFTAKQALEAYRIRWQVELVFKRFKQIASLGHLPKHDDESAKAWLYGKLFVALLTEKIIAEAESLSPWGYRLASTQDAKPLARI